jgi:hypothetical protein
MDKRPVENITNCPVKKSKMSSENFKNFLPPSNSSKSRIVISGMIEDWSTSSKIWAEISPKNHHPCHLATLLLICISK